MSPGLPAAARSIAPHLRKGNLVILESTSPVGTTEQMAAVLKEMRPDLVFPGAASADVDVHLAYCPERIIPGRMLRELVENDRIIGVARNQDTGDDADTAGEDVEAGEDSVDTSSASLTERDGADEAGQTVPTAAPDDEAGNEEDAQ